MSIASILRTANLANFVLFPTPLTMMFPVLPVAQLPQVSPASQIDPQQLESPNSQVSPPEVAPTAAPEFSPSPPATLIEQARQKQNQGDNQGAIALYQQVLQQDPQNRIARQELSLLYAYTRQYDVSLRLLEPLIKEDPQNYQLQLQRAQITSWSGRYRRALRLYDDLLKTYPTVPEIRISRAEVLVWSEKPEEALPEFEAVLRQVPDPSPQRVAALAGTAQAYLFQGRLQDAEALYKSLLEQNPNQRNLLLGLARVYKAKSRPKQAIALLDPLLKNNDADAREFVRQINAPELDYRFRARLREDGEAIYSSQVESRFRINQSDTVQSVGIGIERYRNRRIESVRNIPIRVGVQGQVNSVRIQGVAGVDLFDDTPASPYIKLQTEAQVNPNLLVSGKVTQERLKFDAIALRSEVSAWRLEPTVYWKFDRNTSLFAGYNLGLYSDSNRENQATVYLRHNIGDFFLAGLGYYQSYAQADRPDYFSPASFWIYGGELGWDGKLSDTTRFKISASLGEQRYSGISEFFQSYQAELKTRINSAADLELGYRYSTSNPYEFSAENSNEHNVQMRLNVAF